MNGLKPIPFLLALLGLTVFAAGAAIGDENTESVWPPDGPKWETDPAVAFEKARADRKAVMAFIANAG